MKKHLSLVVVILLACAAVSFAQDRKKLRINEVMVENTSSVTDEYGQHSAWIELFNGNFAPLDISSVYLTNDINNPTKYPVPLGDHGTKVGKRQHVVFYADNNATHGTFHTSFTLVPGRDNWIGIFDADGKTLIDSITIPAALLADQTYARVVDGGAEWNVRTGEDDELYVTPGSPNMIQGVNPKIVNFAQNDANGFGMTIIAMCIVFSALLVLCLCFYGIGEIGKSVARLNKARATGVEVTEIDPKSHDSGEEIAAIAMALHEHFNHHDNESFVLTVRKMKRAYSPWSSKIYGLRELPHRK